MTTRRLLHFVNLKDVGGIEMQFVDFIARSRQSAGWEHEIVTTGPYIHDLITRHLPVDIPLRFERHLRYGCWPKKPTWLARWRQRQLLAGSDAAAIIIWNRLGNGWPTLAESGGRSCIYWEHGAAWFPQVTSAKRRFVAGLETAIVNTRASQRMLELRWGYTGQSRLVRNALRPALQSTDLQPRQAPEAGRVWRLGLAARLVSLKGVAIALHAVAMLVKQGQSVQLEIAGEGPEAEYLRSLSRHLGLGEAVVFRGLVADMAAFYRRIDLLIHPSLHESFGQIVIEAHAHGVPAIVTAVDGLVEAAAHDVSGLCIPPTQSLAAYRELGGTASGLPPYVYYPEQDDIDQPGIMAPDQLASAIRSLMTDPGCYERLSRGAVDRVARHFGFQQHVDAALQAIAEYVGARPAAG